MNVFVWLLLFVPLVVFIAIVLPILIVMHYLVRPKQAAKQRQTAQLEELEALYQHVERLSERMLVIEELLDDRDSHWREER